MLSRIHTFLDADSLEIRFPEFLKDLLVLIHQTLVQHARNQMSGLAVVIKRDRSHFLQIIVKVSGKALYCGSKAAKKVPSAAF